MTSAGYSFLAFVPSFSHGDDALLLAVDYETIDWLMSQFGRLANTPIGSAGPSFVIGDGAPFQSDGCFIFVRFSNQLDGSHLARNSDNVFDWGISRMAAHHYKELLSGLLVPTPAHQFLDADNIPPAPTVLVSRGEYPVEWLADMRVKLRNEAK